jgi:hypothetical protein
MLIVDDNLELVDEWSAKVGPDISGNPHFVAPISYGSRMLAVGREFYTVGKPWADWLASLHRPIMQNTGKLALMFEFMTDINAPSVAQALEFDTRISIGGFNYNFSSQFNYIKGGLWQISGQDASWQDTEFNPGIFEPNVWHPVRFEYSFDVIGHVYSFISVSIGTKRYMVPETMQNLRAPNKRWTDLCGLQVQQDLNKKGGSFSEYLHGIRYIWS